MIAFAGVIIWQNFIKPKTDINDKLGFNTDDYITVGNIKGLTYDLTQKEWDESVNEDTGLCETGEAFATCAGFLSYALYCACCKD